jgi:hypothetical protein
MSISHQDSQPRPSTPSLLHIIVIILQTEQQSCREGDGRWRRGAAERAEGIDVPRPPSVSCSIRCRCGRFPPPSPALFPLSPARFAIPVTGRRQFLLFPTDSLPDFPPVSWAGARTTRDDAQTSGATPFFSWARA